MATYGHWASLKISYFIFPKASGHGWLRSCGPAEAASQAVVWERHELAPVFLLLQVLENGRAVTLDGVLVFDIEFAEYSPAYRFIVLAVFGFLPRHLYE